MRTTFSPSLIPPNPLVLKNLARDIKKAEGRSDGCEEVGLSGQAEETIDDDNNNEETISALENHNNVNHPDFHPTIFTGWDQTHFSDNISRYVILPYTAWASKIVRKPTDVVFMTHVLIYLCTSVPSVTLLVYHFTWWNESDRDCRHTQNEDKEVF